MDVFLFPQRVPSLDDPEPPVHTLDELRLPGLILALFGADVAVQDRHIWEVHVKIVERPNGMLRRVVRVWHQGEVVDESVAVCTLRDEGDYFLSACLMGIFHHVRPGFLSCPASYLVPYFERTSIRLMDSQIRVLLNAILYVKFATRT